MTTDDILEAIRQAMVAPSGDDGPPAATVPEISAATGRSDVYVRNYIRRALKAGTMERVRVWRTSDLCDRRYPTHGFRVVG